MFPPAHLRPLVERQMGLISRSQLLEHGCTSAALSNWLRCGQLETVHRGVYRVAASATSPEQFAHAEPDTRTLSQRAVLDGQNPDPQCRGADLVVPLPSL